jgi:hypothetical protein
MIKSYWNKGKKQKIITIVLGLILLILLFVLRDDYQPVLLFVRKYIFIIILSLLILILGLRKFRKTANTGGRLGVLALLIMFFGILYVAGWHYKMYDYMKTQMERIYLKFGYFGIRFCASF